MRAPTLLVAASLSMIAVPAVAQDFLGRLAQSTAESAARRLADRAVTSVTSPRPAAPPAARPATPAAPRPAAAPTAQPAPQAPASAQVQADAPAASGSAIVLRNKMPVITSDGVRVGETIHVTNNQDTFQPDRSFFTTDQYYMLRRIWPREATVRGGSVHLNMTAAQYRARSQNPPT